MEAALAGTDSFHAYLVLGAVGGSFALLVFTRKSPELILGGALLLLLTLGLVPLNLALSGFSNQGLVTIACLYVVAAAVYETGLLEPAMNKLTGSIGDPNKALARLTLPVAALSSVLNNTPIVAALIPMIKQWSKRKGWSADRFMLPISYAAILGGTCTLVGTSTNLLVYGLVQETPFRDQLGFFDIAKIGVPITAAGILYLIFFSPKLLKARDEALKTLGKTREYTVEMLVREDSHLDGKTIREAGLRNLRGLYLIEIVRGDLVLAAVEPMTKLAAGDRLVFTGIVDCIGDVLQIPGLEMAETQVFKLAKDSGNARLVEAVIGPHNPFIGKTVKEGQFRKRYNAVIIAVVRNGIRVKAKIGDITLRPGDTLLMLARRSFIEQYRFSQDFLVVNGVEDLKLHASRKTSWVWLGLLLLVGLSVFSVVPVVVAAMLGVAVIVGSGSLSWSQAKQSLDLQVLLTIGFAIGLGNGMIHSGAAEMAAKGIFSTFGQHPYMLLIAVYVVTVVLTEMITNSAAAVISFSLTYGVIESLGYNLMPYAIAIMIGASASFVSPLGYQTNLMVFSAGGYRFGDYIKLGGPLSVLVGAIALALIPMYWGFDL